jgi:DNA-binding CsgD family transcriptional regulator
MLAAEKNSFLDLIYESAYEPALIPKVFERLADKMDGNSVWLSQLDAYDGSGGTAEDLNARVDPAWLGRYAEYYGAINPLQIPEDPRRYLREWRPVVMSDEDWMPKDELVRTEFFNGFCKPQDVHSVMWIRLAISGSMVATLNITRSERKGAYTPADFKLARMVQPHLIRAFRTSKRLGLERRRQRELEMLLDLSPTGFFLLDADGTLRHANRAGEKMMHSACGVLTSTGGKLRASQPASARELERLIGVAASADPFVRTGGSMALHGRGRVKPYSVIVTPIGHDRFSHFSGALSVCVSVTDLEAEIHLPAHTLREVFGLTAAEIRVAQALFEGMNLHDIAARFGISHNTVRVQLSSVFDKTRTNRQPELIAMLSRLSHARPD